MSVENWSLFRNMKNHLIKIGEYHNIKLKLEVDRPLKTKFEEIWSREDLRDIVKLEPPKVLFNKKDDKKSQEFLCIGSRLFGQRKFDRALLTFNMAILAGTNPNIEPNRSSPDKVKPLLLAYCMRSNLLCELGRYQESIRDIDIAIELGYPPKKSDVLELRRANCLLGLKRNKEAEKKAKGLLENVQSNKQMVKELEELLQKCKIKDEKSEDTPTGNPAQSDIFYSSPQLPLLKKRYKKDKDLNFVHKDIKINYNSSKGRHMVATEDIEPGEVLLAERATGTVGIMTNRHRVYCTLCLRKVVLAFPCDTCSVAVYCSEHCKNAKRNVHPLECSVFIFLMKMRKDPEVALVFRTILLRFTMEDILSEVNKPENVRRDSLKEARSFFDSPVSYSNLTKLEGNICQRSVDAILESITHAIFLIKIFQRIPQFWKTGSNETVEQSLENLLILGGELTKLLLNFQCNVHAMKELPIHRGKNILCNEYIDVGFAIFKKFCMINHSCNPNCLNSSWRDVKFLYSISFIPKGSEILDSYGERYVSHDFEDRKSNIKESYYFECECEACVNNWPTFKEFCKSPCYWLCPVCETVLNSSFRCDECQKKTKKELSERAESEPKIYDAEALQKDLKPSHENYELAFRELNKYNSTQENIELISKYLSLLSKYTKKPNKNLVEAQELLMRAYDLLGSWSFKELDLYG